MSVIHTPRRPKLDARTLCFPIVIFGGMALILLRLWYIQVVLGPELAERARTVGQIRTPLPAPRGLIVDRNGALVAGEKAVWVVTAEPSKVIKNRWVLDKLARMIRAAGGVVDPAKLWRRTQDGGYQPHTPIPIYSGVSMPVVARITESDEALPGIGLESRAIRLYPDSRSFSHILGYVWVPSPEDVDRAKHQGRTVSELVGKTGIEWEYESDLAGVDGYLASQIDRNGRPIRVAERNAPKPGAELELAIDANLQQTAIRALGSHRGAVVAIEPSTGEVLCMASTPTLDLALFKNGISQSDYEALSTRPDFPFLNRAVASAFSPGSTFKIVTTLAAMTAGVFDPNRIVVCNGGYRLGRQFFACLEHHGAISFQSALEHSCNTYFSDLAMRTGKDALRKTALDLGFFGRSGIDLRYERTGLIPTDDYLARAHRPWVPGYTVLTGIGQGDVLTTPLQMADLACLVANGGTIYRPHLVRSIRRDPSQAALSTPPEILHRFDLPESDWRMIQEAMVGVVQHGTAAGSKIPGIEWAGKTGSAEVHGQAKTNSWFIGYAPAVDPKIAICVMVEGVGHGSEFAAPIAKQVVQRYLLPPAKVASNAVTAFRAHASPARSPLAR